VNTLQVRARHADDDDDENDAPGATTSKVKRSTRNGARKTKQLRARHEDEDKDYDEHED